MLRRDFVAGLGLASVWSTNALAAVAPRKPKRLLVLGGTNFVGPAVVSEALARGHEVTLYNRGVTRPHLFAQIEKLRGRRSLGGSDLRALAGRRRWDAVIDVWPEHRGLRSERCATLSFPRAIQVDPIEALRTE